MRSWNNRSPRRWIPAILQIATKMLEMRRHPLQWERQSGSSRHPTLHVCSSLSTWNRFAVHMPLHSNRRMPTANPKREARAARRITGMICATWCLLIGPKILEARVAIGKAKSRFLSRVTGQSHGAEQGRGGLLCSTSGRISDFTSTINPAHILRGPRGAKCHCCFPPIRECEDKWKHHRIHEPRTLASVPEQEAVLKRAARLMIRIPHRSLPRPHTDPARKRSVGIAL